MALRTAAEYINSLRDGRAVYYRGARVPDVTSHPVTRMAVEHAALDFRMAEDPTYRDLAVVEPATRDNDDAPGPYSRYFAPPRAAADLRARSQLIETATRLGRTLVVLVKEIGTDALFALHLVAHAMDRKLGTSYLPRVQAFYRHCRDGDLAMAVAQTDVKGDRSLGPAAQAAQGNPDAYVRIVDRRPDGIVVRGAKAHTSVSVNANELIVLPTRALTAEDRDYAVAFAVPLDTPGLRLIASAYGSLAETHAPGAKRPSTDAVFERPISARHKMLETVTIFDDVFVPHERVFLAGEWQYAGPLALTFVEYHRFTAVSYKLPLVDLLVGTAFLMADYNGIARAGHVRDKATWLVAYAETLRALVEQAAERCQVREPGLAVPEPLTVNMAKWHFAHNFHQALGHVQDIAGGLLVTGPALADLRNPETGDLVRRYLGGRAGVSAEDRLRAINLVADLTTGDFGGYQAVLAIHAEGSLEAEKLTLLRNYDPRRAIAYARNIAGISG